MKNGKKFLVVLAAPMLLGATMFAISYRKHVAKIRQGFRWE